MSARAGGSAVDVRPNVVICISDQLRAPAVGCYGDPLSLTPRIDALASAGTRWTTACSPSPVCTPARSMLFSSQPARTCIGTLANAGDPVDARVGFPAPTLGEAFAAAGYDTHYVGKWHLAPRPDVLGFAEWTIPDNRHRNSTQTFFQRDGSSEVVEGWAPDHELARAQAFLAGRTADDPPFLLVHSISPPHMPLADMPERFRDLVAPQDVPLRPNVYRDGRLPCDDDWFRVYLWDFLYYQQRLPHTATLPAGFDLRHLAALYAGAVAWTDDIVGRLVTALDETGHADDTVVVFTADHGDNLGSHGLFNKEYPTDESIRIPLIARGPGVPVGAVRDDVATITDVATTVAAAAGVPAVPGWTGRDLAVEADGDAVAFLDTSSGHVGVRTANRLVALPRHAPLAYKPSLDDLVGRPLFFDLDSDPYQQRNLASHGLPDDLVDMIVEWERTTPRLELRSIDAGVG